MENSSYGSNPLPPSALVALSQASNLSDAFRLPRPFPHQSVDGKDIPIPFSAASFGLNLNYPSLPTHLLHLPPFFHPDYRIPFGGAFRPPLGQPTPEDLKQLYHPFQLKPQSALNSSPLPASSASLPRYPPFPTSLTPLDPRYRVHNPQQPPQSYSSERDSSSPSSPNSLVPHSLTPSGTHTNLLLSPASLVAAGGAGATTITAVPGGVQVMGQRDMDPPPSSLAEERDRDTIDRRTPSSDAGTERSTPGLEDTRKRRKKLDPSCCPACSITLRPGDMHMHLAQEIERLDRLSRSHGPGHRQSPNTTTGGASSSKKDNASDSRWETYHRVRTNRQSRVRAKTRKRRNDAEESDEGLAASGTPASDASGGSMLTRTACPICGDRLVGMPDQLNAHVVQCLRKQEGMKGDEDEQLDVEGDTGPGDSYEEYEWAGQKRIRTSTLLQGGFAALGLQTCKKEEDDDCDVVVDGDEAIYGAPQYTESDVMRSVSEMGEEESMENPTESNLNGVIPKMSPNDESLHSSSDGGGGSDYSQAVQVKTKNCHWLPGLGPNEGADEQNFTPPVQQILEALKQRISQLEDEAKEIKDKFKCLICLGSYKHPLVSTTCWHVHCEECWLQSLGAKKLCPQCNVITSPSGLRRIYL